MAHKAKAQSFLDISDKFKLGELPTEKSHPKTKNLSSLSQSHLDQALEIIKEIEINLLNIALSKQSKIKELTEDVQKALQLGGRIFLCGCGATGRLSLALETIWNKSGKEKGRVISFMAGGDVALIHSIENFEDHPEFGKRQLEELGFNENDLLLAITEGGETPFVIGAVNAASEVANSAPYFLYCNPDEVLCQTVERSREVIENRKIKKLNLCVGEMVLAGSTRMQASTIQMLVAGQALFNFDVNWVQKLKDKFEEIDFSFLKKFIERESEVYKRNDGVVYSTCDLLGISVLTDTTERSPTFSLLPFERNVESRPKQYSLCYLSLEGELEVQRAWTSLLDRTPRCLEWIETKELTSIERLYGFDISARNIEKRKSYCSGEQHIFRIELIDESLKFRFEDLEENIRFEKNDLLSIHLILKVLLNTHSTLVMGRLGRYESNIMTWVRPSNNKLIDRTIRYILILLSERGIEKSYEEVCYKLFEVMEEVKKDDPLVLKTLESLL
ncbi:SIS domain-containing protein [Halobacteriovorax sp. JY17]|uniref:SIS domain-containing protein n=1 Tax=Halobacteriovorax sp. JY17 TaxID=2014617 RepID=UPI000C3BEB5C|nr:SIS domain-containing protein [Halobacteriovorax sp. JY17]PIK16071.1 MAG: hypothetical protein CES88_04895 [Halobacteriovorax sp. JY17]